MRWGLAALGRGERVVAGITHRRAASRITPPGARVVARPCGPANSSRTPPDGRPLPKGPGRRRRPRTGLMRVLPRPGARTRMGVSSVQITPCAKAYVPIASASGRSHQAPCPTQSASVWRSIVDALARQDAGEPEQRQAVAGTWRPAHGPAAPGPGRPRSIGRAGAGAWKTASQARQA